MSREVTVAGSRSVGTVEKAVGRSEDWRDQRQQGSTRPESSPARFFDRPHCPRPWNRLTKRLKMYSEMKLCFKFELKHELEKCLIFIFFCKGTEHKGTLARRSLDPVKINDSVGIQDIRHMIKRYVTSIIVGSVCLAPGKVCVAGPPGPRGIRGPKGTKGRKGKQGIVGPSGEQGKQGMMGDIGPTGIKGEKGRGFDVFDLQVSVKRRYVTLGTSKRGTYSPPDLILDNLRIYHIFMCGYISLLYISSIY